MTRKRADPKVPEQKLRRQAEKKAEAAEAKILEAPSPEEARQALHELRVHQIELEMHNEELRRAQAELDAVRARYFNLYDLAPVGYCTVSEQGLILEANLTAATLLGEARGALIKTPITRFILPEDQDIYYRHRKPLFETDAPQICEFRMVRKGGAIFWARVEATVAPASDGASVCRAVISDINDRREAETKLRQSEMLYRSLAENSPDLIARFDRQCRHIFVNSAAAKAGLLPPEEYIGKTILEVGVPEQEAKKWEERIGTAFETGQIVEVEDYFETPSGLRTFYTKFVPEFAPDGSIQSVQSVARDTTERKRAEEAVQASLKEKEILLREIHHRVKNNMQIISSLFNLQSGHIKDESARSMLKEGQLRIRSMALVHEKLYQSRDLSKIDFADYLRSLSDHLFQFFKVDADRIRLETDLEHVHLDINSAVPCGLLVSELITNALKHAFPGDRKGVVGLRLHRGHDGTVELRVADDGVGFPEASDFRNTESLGLQIVSLLVGQLEGTIELDRENGSAFIVVFREMEYRARA